MARANSFASPDPDTYYYEDRKWQYVGDVPYNFVKDGVLQVDRRAYVYYMALGNSPAMMAKNVGVGSYYLWTYKDAAGEFLDGAKNYKLHIPAKVPAKDFWSVLVYDSLSRSELKNGQKFPSVSLYSGPKINADGSVDVYFGPEMPAGQEKNWIKTVPGKGWFPIFRFYGPLRTALRQDLDAEGHRAREIVHWSSPKRSLTNCPNEVIAKARRASARHPLLLVLVPPPRFTTEGGVGN